LGEISDFTTDDSSEIDPQTVSPDHQTRVFANWKFPAFSVPETSASDL
jgi:hypothetical protein